MTVGLISDTHGLARPEALRALMGVEAILHAGDVGAGETLESLKALAPVYAVRGNIDTATDALDLPLTLRCTFEGVQLLVIHELAHLQPAMLLPMTDLVVYGHSHKPASYTEDGLHYVNPGAAGPKRFSLPLSVALLHITAGRWEVAFINLLDARPLP